MQPILNKILNAKRIYKQLIVLSNDIVIAVIALYLSFSIRHENFHIPYDYEMIIYTVIFIFIPIFISLKIYESLHSYAGLSSLRQIILACTINGFIFLLIIVLFEFPYISRSIGLLYPIIFIVGILISRIIAVYIINIFNYQNEIKNVLIYGAGKRGINTALTIDASSSYRLCGFIESDSKKIGKRINNIIIYSEENINQIVDKYKINNILITTNDDETGFVNRLISKIEFKSIEINKVPKIFDEPSENLSIYDFKNLEIQDLIDRKIVIKNEKLNNLYNKVIFISGAGGSIGSEICNQLLNHSPKKIILYDHSEYNLYTINQKLDLYIKEKKFSTEVIPILGSIKNTSSLDKVFLDHKPDFVFHAAAYKHVPMVEINSIEAIENNTIGTINLLDVSEKYQVENFSLISTDKAVRPTNIMGASKRLAELILQAKASELKKIKNNTIFSIIRFGNVLGSSGSVVPLFYDQIKKGGPLTITHKEITRYFMTIKEAATLVLHSTKIARGNQVFILDMGKSIRILDLAKRMIKLSGLKERNANNTSGDIEIKIIGLRPGEKLHEELTLSKKIKQTSILNILEADEEFFEISIIQTIVSNLREAIKENNSGKLKDILINADIGYRAKIND
tara:strand:- start:1866 stop:3740 length:1875 start_codon:yes stop_codon:yes gene_type:complete